MPLHLLRGVPPNIDGEPVELEAFLRLCRLWESKGHVFGSWTRNCPRRLDELKGGSVYFVRKGQTMFRMPLIAVCSVAEFCDPDPPPKGYEAHTAFVCDPALVTVGSHPVRFLRGWRYLKGDDAPPDLPRQLSTDYEHSGEMPPEMRRDLKEAGLL